MSSRRPKIHVTLEQAFREGSPDVVGASVQHGPDRVWDAIGSDSFASTSLERFPAELSAVALIGRHPSRRARAADGDVTSVLSMSARTVTNYWPAIALSYGVAPPILVSREQM